MEAASETLALLAECCRLAYQQKLVGGTGGNMSVRIGDEVYITATGCRLGDVEPDTFSRLRLDGRLDAGTPPPSKELGLHLAVYRARPDVNAIAHLHPLNSIVVSILAPESGQPMPAYSTGYKVKIPSCGIVPNLKPGSPELADALSQAILKADVVLIKNHGIVAAAGDIKAAFSLVEEAELNAALHVILKGQGALP